MKVLIINVALRPDSEKIIFPIGIGYIATAVHNANYPLEVLDLDALRLNDEQIEEYIKKRDVDVVLMGCIVTGYKYVKKLSLLIKKYWDIPVIAGNTVASSIPEILLNNTGVDVAVLSEGDITIVELLKTLENKGDLKEVAGIVYKKGQEIITTAKRPEITDLKNLQHINYDLLDMEVYLKNCKKNVSEPYPVPFEELVSLPVNTARGCLYKCTFCYHAFIEQKYRVRSPVEVCEEIRLLQEKYKVNHIQFFDELTLFSRKQAEAFADAILASNLTFYWVADCRGNLFKEDDLELLKKMKSAGCISLGYSLESGDEEILKKMKKKIKIQDFIDQSKVIRKSGIVPCTSIVIGYPEETEETLKKTFDVCFEAEVYPSTGYLLPQPGTPMYEYAKETGLIQDEEAYILTMNDRQDFLINFTKMSPERMQELVKEHLFRIAEKLNLGYSKENLIKTGHYRQKVVEHDH